jgi:hypothetical protein
VAQFQTNVAPGFVGERLKTASAARRANIAVDPTPEGPVGLVLKPVSASDEGVSGFHVPQVAKFV